MPECPSCGEKIEKCRDVSLDPEVLAQTGIADPCGHKVSLAEV